MGSWFPNQRLNLHPLHWKQSLPLDHQGSFDVGVLVYKVRDRFHKGSIVIVVFIFILKFYSFFLGGGATMVPGL